VPRSDEEIINEVHNSFAQRRQTKAAGQFDGLGKTAIPRHNATPQQNRDSSGTGRLVPQSAGESISQSARAKRVDCASQENGDAEKDTQCRDYLGHCLAPGLAIPGRAALRNWR
jgi:hypothetical protein